MDRKKNLNQRHDLSWTTRINSWSDLPIRSLSPVFKTTQKVDWKLCLWTGPYREEDFLYCTLLRMLDDGPSRVHYLVNCRVFIGDESLEDKAFQIGPQVDKTFNKGSALDFRLLSVCDIRSSMNESTLEEPVKLILKIRLQRQSLASSRAKSLSVTTAVRLHEVTENYSLENYFYKSKNKEIENEEGPKPPKTKQPSRDKSITYIGLIRGRGNEWHPINVHMPHLNTPTRFTWHLLDTNGQCHVSSTTRMYETTMPDITIHPVYLVKTDDLIDGSKSLSRDGEITVRREKITPFKSVIHVKKQWIYPVFSGRNGTFRSDLDQLFQNGSNGANLEFRVEGRVFKVHKAIIGARSPVLNAMLSTDMVEKFSKVVQTEDLDPNTLRNFLRYLYSGMWDNCLEWDFNKTCDLYKTARKYFVESLHRVCRRNLASGLSLETKEIVSNLLHLFQDKSLENNWSSFNQLLGKNSICCNGCPLI